MKLIRLMLPDQQVVEFKAQRVELVSDGTDYRELRLDQDDVAYVNPARVLAIVVRAENTKPAATNGTAK